MDLKLVLNANKTKCMLFTSHNADLNEFVMTSWNGTQIERVPSYFCRLQNNWKLGTGKSQTSVSSRQLGTQIILVKTGKIWKTILKGHPTRDFRTLSRAHKKVRCATFLFN
jgi:hypothetical protein